ncbi:phasin family protein [Hydrocarboniphaga sp.]|uniref:phasin family protein n=1 Tax=Hydrocarboniphaga sp. TaxID=2033016 RepID=UPI003D14B5DE
MKAKHRLDQLKKQFDRMRKDSLAALGTNNEAVYAGLQKFAEKELKALHEYCEGALGSLREQKKSGIQTIVQTQLDLLQDTVTRLVANARESMDIVTGAGKSAPAAAAPVTPAKKAAPKKAAAKKAVPAKKAAPAKKAPTVKKTAKRASAKKTAG